MPDSYTPGVEVQELPKEQRYEGKIPPRTFIEVPYGPAQMKDWIPNSHYGAHAFGKKDFAEFLAERETILSWIAEYSPYALASKDGPPVALFPWQPEPRGRSQWN